MLVDLISMLVDVISILYHYIIPVIIPIVTSIVTPTINYRLNVSLSLSDNMILTKKKNLKQVFIDHPKLKRYYHKIEEELLLNQRYLILYFIIFLGFPYLIWILLLSIFHSDYDTLIRISNYFVTYLFVYISFNYVLLFLQVITATMCKNTTICRTSSKWSKYNIRKYSIKIFYICLASIVSLVLLAIFVFCITIAVLTKITNVHSVIIILKKVLAYKYSNHMINDIIILTILLLCSYKYITKDIIDSEKNKIICDILPNLHSNKMTVRIYTAHRKIEGVIWNIFDDKHIVIKDGAYLAYIPWNEVEFIEIEEISNENDTIINDE